MRILLAGLFLGLSITAQAGPITPLLDINRTVRLPSSGNPPVKFGSKWLVGLCSTNTYYCEPWVTDGTEDGTVRLAPMASGLTSSFAVSGSYAYFTGDSGTGNRIWRTDGTPGGTVALAATGVDSGSLAVAGPYVFYTTGNSYSYNYNVGAVWRSDGTAEGTVKLADLFQPTSLTAVGSTVFFVATGGIWGRELWKTDGTFAGTGVVRDIIPGTDSSGPVKLAAVGNQLFFWARQSILSAPTLWVSDGSTAGTVEAASISPADMGDIVDFGGKAHFLAYGSNGTMSLLQSDGTPGGLVVLHTWTGGSIQKMVVAGAYLYMAAPIPGSSALWRTDGTVAGTVQATDSTITVPVNLVAAGGALHFLAFGSGGPQHLYRTAGTPATTTVEIATNFGTPYGDINGQLLLSRDLAWITDGTTTHPFRTAAGQPNNNSYCVDGNAVIGNVALFAANDGEHGCELWRTDGTAAGTTMVMDLAPGDGSGIFGDSYSGTDPQFTASNGLVYFVGQNPASGMRTLWRTDGTTAGTFALFTSTVNSNVKIAASGFGAYAFMGNQLLRTDGTVAGTSVLATYGYPGDTPTTSSLVVLGNSAVWIAAAGGTYGGNLVLYRSDGTSAGTGAYYSMPQDPNSYYCCGYDAALYAANGLAFFRGYSAAAGSELWRTDGTAAGTQLVLDISPGASSGMGSLFGTAGKYVLFTGPNGLWSSDGTAAGTTFLNTITPYYYTPPPRAPDPYYFFSSIYYPYGIVRTDGTVAGTVVIPGNSDAYNLTPVGSSAFFLGSDYTSGRELWMASGTGSAIVTDYVAGTGSLLTTNSTAGRMAVLPAGLVFFAGAPNTSIEPMFYAFAGTPDAMTFASVSPVSPGATVVGGPAQVTGITATAVASASGGQLCVSSSNGCACDRAPFGSSAAVERGNYVCLRQTASLVASTTTTTTLTIGGMTATFSATTGATQHLAVALAGLGRGNVSSDIPAINCGLDCAEDVPYGTTITLAAVQQPGSVFTGWTGACFGLGPCAVRMTAAASVTANFAAGARKGLPPDLDGDGSADLVWKDGSGNTGAWLMNGTSYRAANIVAAPVPGATVFMTGDFNGDARTDLVWKTAAGAFYLTLQDGLASTSTAALAGPGAGWTIVAKGDFNGDGKTDLVWRNTGGAYQVTLMNGATVASAAALTPTLPAPSIALIADFNGDGKSDIVWSGGDGSASMFLMDGTTITEQKQLLGGGTGWTAAFFGDLDGDGQADLIWRHTDGRHGIWFMHGTTAWTYATLIDAGTGWNVKLVRDFDGDGKSDVLWAHPDGSHAMWLMGGGAVKNYKMLLGAGTGWSVVASEDYDGDGKDDLLWRSSAGAYALWLMDGVNVKAYRSILDAGSGWEALP